MVRAIAPLVILVALILAAHSASAQGTDFGVSSTPISVQSLRANFASPPAYARPMVRWWWFGAAVEKPEILRELQRMKANGIGGAELAFVYPEVLDDTSKGIRNLPFLSPAMLDAVTYAQAQGRALGSGTARLPFGLMLMSDLNRGVVGLAGGIVRLWVRGVKKQENVSLDLRRRTDDTLDS